MSKILGFSILSLIVIFSASGLVIAQHEFGPSPLKFKLMHNFGNKNLFDIRVPSYDLSQTFRIQSDNVSELNAGREHVERYINGFQEEIEGLDGEIAGIESTAISIKSAVASYEGKAGQMIEEASVEAKKASSEQLNQYESYKVDVAETVYEDNVPIQKDIFMHSKELYKDIDDPDSFGVLPI